MKITLTIEIDDTTKEVTISPKEQFKLHTEKENSVVIKKRKDGKKFGLVSVKKCAHCGKEFQPTSNVQRYCPENCRANKPKTEITKEQIERSQSKPFSDYR